MKEEDAAAASPSTTSTPHPLAVARRAKGKLAGNRSKRTTHATDHQIQYSTTMSSSKTRNECSDGTICENSAPCVPHPTKESKYMCDCAAARGPAEDMKFAGVYCEHAASSYCQRNSESYSDHAFCTNGGECREYVGRKEEHAGCKCPPGYEGHYCQFVEGSMPSDWTLTDYVHPSLVHTYPSSSGIGAGGIAGIVIGSAAGLLVIVGVLAGYLWCGSLGTKLRRDGKEADTGDRTFQGEGGRSGSATSPQNAQFIGGKSVYKKKTSTGNFVTPDTLEADGGVLRAALGEGGAGDAAAGADVDVDNATSMEDVDLAEVDLGDGPNKGEMA